MRFFKKEQNLKLEYLTCKKLENYNVWNSFSIVSVFFIRTKDFVLKVLYNTS